MNSKPHPFFRVPKTPPRWFRYTAFIFGLLTIGLGYRSVILQLGNSMYGHVVAIGIFLSMFIVSAIVFVVVVGGRRAIGRQAKRGNTVQVKNQEES
jgi:hypothetical protein